MTVSMLLVIALPFKAHSTRLLALMLLHYLFLKVLVREIGAHSNRLNLACKILFEFICCSLGLLCVELAVYFLVIRYDILLQRAVRASRLEFTFILGLIGFGVISRSFF
jgi:hypothetical protein